LSFKTSFWRSGEAGKYIGWTLAKSGERTAVIERRLIGGSCPNIACLPSKNIIQSVKVVSLAWRAAEFSGVESIRPTLPLGVKIR
jgi:pyruvate/2-oxoglutarate dehydrogenase complex dihydrolipoamide dehydrogenase (E3) component